MRNDLRFWGYVAGVAALMAAFGLLGGTRALGAHPFWSGQVAFVGIAAGLPVAAVLSQIVKRRTVRIGAVTAVLMLSVLVTYVGKARFVASFAEDFVAGRGWYFGWMAICTCLVVLALQFVPRFSEKP